MPDTVNIAPINSFQLMGTKLSACARRKVKVIRFRHLYSNDVTYSTKKSLQRCLPKFNESLSFQIETDD